MYVREGSFSPCAIFFRWNFLELCENLYFHFLLEFQVGLFAYTSTKLWQNFIKESLMTSSGHLYLLKIWIPWMKECKLPVHTILMPSIAFDAIKTFYCSIYLLLRFVEYSPSYRLVIPCDCDVYIFFRKSNSGIEEEVRFVLEVLVLLDGSPGSLQLPIFWKNFEFSPNPM